MIKLLHGDCREVLKTLPDKSVHCVVTSPPYWGLRDYGVTGQLGLESSPPQEYVEQMVAVFREVRRVLRDDGTLWLNMGDSYSSGNRDYPQVAHGGLTGPASPANGSRRVPVCADLKPKDLVGIPWRVAFALQADGWYLRQDIIWSKPNPMPESVTDRCTKAHEYIFLLSKSARYYYDADAIAERSLNDGRLINYDGSQKNCRAGDLANNRRTLIDRPIEVGATRNKRSVWEVATAPFSEAHFATFPPALIGPCILAGCPEKACAKCGAPWIRMQERFNADGNSVVVAASERHARDSDGTPLMGDNMMQYGVRGSFNVGVKGTAKKNDLGFSPPCSCNVGTVPGVCLDPFGGAGTTGLVADRLGRNAILIELNTQYAAMASRRIKDDAGMFANVVA